MSNEKKDMSVEITQDKILDVLMHAATREDISEIRSEMKDLRVELKEDITNLRSEMKDLRIELKEDIASLRVEMSQLRNEGQNNFRLLMGTVLVGILVPIVIQLVG